MIRESWNTWSLNEFDFGLRIVSNSDSEFPKTNPKTHRITAELLTAGANPAYIYNRLYEQYPLDRVRLKGHVINSIKTEADELPITDDPCQVQRILELRFAARAAEMILQAALRREESRGAHFREDFPVQDERNWRGHLQIRLSAEGKLNYKYVSI